MSRHNFMPTADHRDIVEATIAFGIPEAEVCQLIKNPQTGKPISEHTLRKHFAAEIAVGAVKLKAKVGTLIVNTILARKDPVTKEPLGINDERTRGMITVFFAKTRMGWKETTVHEHTGAIEIKYAADDLDRKIARLLATGATEEIPPQSE
jgi:hypothetical protein